MKNHVSLKHELYLKLKDVPPYEIVEAAIKLEPSLTEGEDYLVVGSDIYLRIKSVLYVIGRFAVTELDDLTDTVVWLCQDNKKTFSGFNDDRLPQLDSREQEWNDYMLPTIKSNAKFLEMEYNAFLSEVYREMDVNFPLYTGEYLNRINMPDITRITKFRVVTCTKELRIAFEEAMNRIMVMHREARLMGREF